MKKILIVKTGMGLGGIERSLVEFLRGLDYSRYQVDLLLLYGPFNLLPEINPNVNIINAEEKAGKIRLHPLYMLLYALSIFFRFFGFRNLFQKFKSRKQDFYYKKLYQRHCQVHYDTALAYQQTFACEYICRFVSSDQKVMMYHHGDIEDQEYLEPWFRKTDILVTVGDGIKLKLEQAFSFLKGKVVVIKNYIDPVRVLEKAEEYKPEMKKDCLVLCTCGRISPEKGFDLAVNAADILKKNDVLFHWYFVGGGYPENKRKIVQKISELKLDNYITVTGFVNNPYPYLQHCDILVVPSRFEANPMILLEAKILKKLIVTTKTDGANELLEHGKNALFCDISAESIASEIQFLSGNMKIQQELIQHLRCRNDERQLFYLAWNDVFMNNERAL